MRVKKVLSVVLVAVVSLCLVACSKGTSGKEATDAELTLKAGHVLTEDSPYHLALIDWAKEIEEQTEGRVKIEIFANSVLGNERDMIEALQMGTLDITLPNSAPLNNFTDTLKVFDLPFLFMNREDAYTVIDSEIGEEMLDSLGEIGVVGVSMWENGFRHIANNKKEIVTPEDLAGLKIRTMENPIHMASFKAWGADATAMAWGEVYTALQQKTIDGLENPFTPIYQNKLQEVAPYITMTGHFYCPAPLLFSQVAWDKISEADQEIIREISDKYKDVERKMCEEIDEEYKAKMIDEGVQVVEEIDKELWREAVRSVYDQYEGEVGKELLEEIQEIMAK